MSNSLDFLSNQRSSGLESLEQLEFEGEIGLYEDYLKTLEEFFRTETQKHIDSIKQLRATGKISHLDDGMLPPEEESDNFHLERIDQFINVLRRSFLVSVYSFFESQLVAECRSRKRDNILLSFSDLAGQNEIDKVKTYFTKVLRAKFPSSTPEWQEIQNLRRLRNCIIHNQGRLTEGLNSNDQKALREYISQKSNLSVRYDEIYVDSGFCEEAYHTIKTFLCMLLFGNKGLT